MTPPYNSQFTYICPQAVKKVLDKWLSMVYKDFKRIKQTLDAEVKLPAHPQRVPHS